MKKFDFYGQMVLIIFGLLLAIPLDEMSFLFAGLLMFVAGVWQLLSTIINLLNKDTEKIKFFQTNLFIAIGYIIAAIVLWEVVKTSRDLEKMVWITMMALPPLLIFRYWICISRIYGVGFFKKKIKNIES
ncbi:MAG: hypothetical protein ABIX01_19825 [Chitinophagaceae bacterium]